MKLPKIVESLLLVVLFCSLLGCTTALVEHLDAKRSPQTFLKQLIFFTNNGLISPTAKAPQALFDGQTIKKTILGLLDKAQPQDEICVTTFIMTDGDIAQAIIKKHKQGVKITVVADNSHAQKDYSKVPDLIKAGISVYLHNPASPDIMHNKFLIFEFQNYHPVVLTGSYNPTNSAATKNAENMVIIAHTETKDQYKGQFAKLVAHSVRAQVPEPKKPATRMTKETFDAILKNGLPT